MLKPTDCQRKYCIPLGFILSACLLFMVLQVVSAPVIQPQRVTSLDGQLFQLPDAKKKLSWVNFWSISCPPCLAEMPELQTLYQKYQYSSDIQIVTVAMYYDPPNLIKEVQTRLGLTLPIGLDLNGQIAANFTTNMVTPSHYLIDSSGHILYSHQGALSQQQLEQHITNFL